MIDWSTAVRARCLAAIAAAIDGADSGGWLYLHAAPRPQPGEPADPPLAALRLPQPCTGSLIGTTLRLAPIPDGLCLRSGRVAWARLTDGDGRWLADCDVGAAASGAEINVTPLDVLAGGAVTIDEVLLLG